LRQSLDLDLETAGALFFGSRKWDDGVVHHNTAGNKSRCPPVRERTPTRIMLRRKVGIATA
jgi:hypothetical protein